jgi:hypothetical protein
MLIVDRVAFGDVDDVPISIFMIRLPFRQEMFFLLGFFGNQDGEGVGRRVAGNN